ncbi:MAG: hypothetical protein V1819_01150, partial [bacterium]
MRQKIIFKLLLALAIPLLLAWAISSVSANSNLKLLQIIGFLILIAFGLYTALTIFFRFGRSMKVASREKNLVKKFLIFSVILLLLIAIIIGIDKFFETA